MTNFFAPLDTHYLLATRFLFSFRKSVIHPMPELRKSIRCKSARDALAQFSIRTAALVHVSDWTLILRQLPAVVGLARCSRGEI
jgi:hypothetical protein